ncbi:hypothetical protein P389DRAFT_143654 [Cystobasidium minutum MCA 4210]|uniref:uncharacterized protein n=1 Tax=Cystobasidium minutum MCA 4210 TaxID=1397322 RepID=UPI0034CDB7CC|eukprot:jgi/Rhomi1/143654/e_gw1.4.822.1
MEAAPAASPPPEDKSSTLGELVCPICLGSPTPLVITECGHTFCGPCLHAAIVAQPITPQMLQDIPSVAGKDLEGTCPVCRHPLAGGWGRSLRGGILKMEMVEIAI